MNMNLIFNIFWKFFESISSQFVTLIVSIVLARLLTPDDYGIITTVMIFISLANVFVYNGMGIAIIQKKNVDDLDYSSVFWFNFIISILIYISLYLFAPYISMFFNNKYIGFINVIRVLGLRIIIASINSIQYSYISKNMRFKDLFKSNIVATILSGMLGIYLAMNNYGVWALVWQYLSYSLISAVLLMIIIKMNISFSFSLERINGLMNFGLKNLIVSFMITGYQELRSIVIAKFYAPSELAFYDKGKQFPNIIISNINDTTNSVLFPKLSNCQDDYKEIKELTKKAIKFGTYFVFPLMLGFFAVARNFILVVLTDKWVMCVEYLQLFCLINLFNPIHDSNINSIKAIGRIDIYLRLEVIKKIIETLVLFCTMFIGIKYILYGMLLTSVGFIILNSYPNQKIIGYRIIEQFTDILPNLVISIIMSLVVFAIGFLPLDSLILLIIQVIFGIVLYVALSIMTKNNEFFFIIEVLKKIRKD